jgi:hypothetical protein
MVANPYYAKNKINIQEVKMTETIAQEGKDNRPTMQIRNENARKTIEFAKTLTSDPKEVQKIINRAYKICLGE